MTLPVPPNSPDTADAPERAYFHAVRMRIDVFATQRFSLRGTIALHRHALGADILRAPLNVVLSPGLVLIRLLGALFGLLRIGRVARWLRGRRILLRTQVAAQVEMAVVTELLGIHLQKGATADSAALSRTILAAPQFRNGFRAKADVVAATASATGITNAIAEYSGARSAVADITNALLALIIGGLVFQTVTPGIISMAPTMANALALEAAIQRFPLGQTAGAIWYGVFSTEASPWLLGVNVAALLLAGSVIGAFAGIIADPIQLRLGIHRRRLLRFVDAVEDELTGAGGKGFATREHLYARLADIWDAAVSIFRFFRG